MQTARRACNSNCGVNHGDQLGAANGRSTCLI
jgi:hypothetical protein